MIGPDGAVAESELIEYARSLIAHFKVPDEIEFVTALPRTSTGKVQKYELREHERAARAASAG